MLECHPLYRGLHILLSVTSATHLVHIVLGGLEVDARIELLGVFVPITATTAAGIHLLLAVHLVMPLEVHIVGSANYIFQSMEVNIKLHIIFVTHYPITELNILILAHTQAVAHVCTEVEVYCLVRGYLINAICGYRQQLVAILSIGRKHQVLGIDNPRVLCREDEVHVVASRCDKLQRHAVVGGILAKYHFLHLCAHVGERNLHQLVFHLHIHRVAEGAGVKDSHVAALVSLQLTLGTGVALHGQAVQVRLHGRHAVGISHAVHIRLPYRVIHTLTLGDFLLAGGYPPHVPNKNTKN